MFVRCRVSAGRARNLKVLRGEFKVFAADGDGFVVDDGRSIEDGGGMPVGGDAVGRDVGRRRRGIGVSSLRGIGGAPDRLSKPRSCPSYIFLTVNISARGRRDL